MVMWLNKVVNFIKNLFLKNRARNNSIYYINGSERLPPPLSAEEEALILSDYDGENKEIKEILITHNLRLVVYIAKKFDNSPTGLEDLISIGTIGLIKAVNTFRTDKNIKLATYASRCIENEILMYLRKFSSQRSEISIDEPLNVDWDGNELLLSDILGSSPDEISEKIENDSERELLNGLVDKLSGREKTIMKMRFGLGECEELTQKEVADKLGISQSYISRLEKRIILKLKEDMEALV